MSASTQLRGARPRPRVAVIGSWSETDLAALRQMFATVWPFAQASALLQRVAPRELDLILAADTLDQSALADVAHFITFSRWAWQGLPEPITGETQPTTSEEYTTPSCSGLLDRARQELLEIRKGVRGSTCLKLSDQIRNQYGALTTTEQSKANVALVSQGALVCTDAGQTILGFQIVRASGFGLAWLPGFENRIPWVRAIYAEWSRSDPERLPGWSEWQRYARWQTVDERIASDALAALADERAKLLGDLDARERVAHADMDRAHDLATRGARRLLLAQGDDLVAAAADAFRSLGFRVKEMDADIPQGQPKREDLQLRVDDDPTWIAMVEVKGYARSGAKASDLQVIRRHQRIFERAEGRAPSVIIYVCNGQHELPPDARQRPFASAPDDAAVFAEDDGLVIDTRDLFQLLAAPDPHEVRNRIRASRGVLSA